MQMQQQIETIPSQSPTWQQEETPAAPTWHSTAQTALPQIQSQAGVEGIESLLEQFRAEMRGQMRRKRIRRLTGRITIAAAGALYILFTVGGGLAQSQHGMVYGYC